MRDSIKFRYLTSALIALGDFIFKFPQILTRKVILNTIPGPKVAIPVETYLDRIVTPPYVTNNPELHHIKLTQSDKYLILSSDGLSDLAPLDEDDAITKNRWANVVGRAGGSNVNVNKALALLREEIGGSDEEKVSRVLMSEIDRKWMDDTSIVVLELK